MTNKIYQPTKGKWKVLRGNGTHYATINSGAKKRICTIEIPSVNEMNGFTPGDEAICNIQLLGAAKENYEALERISREASEAIGNSLNGKEVDSKLLVGQIADFAQKAI